MNNCVPMNNNYCGEQSQAKQQQQQQIISNTTTNKRTRGSSSSTIIAVVLLSLFGFWIFLWTLMLALRSIFKKLVQKGQKFPRFSKQPSGALKREFQQFTTSTTTTM